MPGPALSLRGVVVEAAEVGDEVRAADVLELAVLELRAVGLEDEQPRVRQAALRVADVVAADGDVEPAVAVHIADAGLAVVGGRVGGAEFVREVAELVPRAVAHQQRVSAARDAGRIFPRASRRCG